MLLQNTVAVRKQNCKAIKQAVKLLGAATKKQVAELTGLSFSTCNNLINDMTQTGELISLEEIQQSELGRPSIAYQLNADFSFVLCAVLERQNRRFVLRLVLHDLYGKAVSEVTQVLQRADSAEICAAIRALRAKRPNLAVIGVSVPGVVRADGTILICDNSLLAGVNLAQQLSTEFGVPVLCENDMNLVAYGMDTKGEFSELSSVAVIADYAEDCPGAGLVVEGKILRGSTNFAGEISYLPACPKEHLERLAFQMACITSLIDPALIAVAGNQCTNEELPRLRQLLRALIPPEHCPEIELLNDPTCIVKGLARLCLQYAEREET